MRCPVLRGDRVCLRQWRAEEAEDYVDGRDDEVFRWTTERRDLTAAQAAQGFSHYDGVDGVYPFAIVEHATDRPVGNLPVTVQGDRAEIAYRLAPDARGRGLLAEADHLNPEPPVIAVVKQEMHLAARLRKSLSDRGALDALSLPVPVQVRKELVAHRRVIQLPARGIRHLERAQGIVDDAAGQRARQQREFLRAHRIERRHRPGVDVESQHDRRRAGVSRFSQRVHDEPRRPVDRIHQRRHVLILFVDRAEMHRQRVPEPAAHGGAGRRPRGHHLARREVQAERVARVADEGGRNAVEAGRDRRRRRQVFGPLGRAAPRERFDDRPARHVIEVLRGALGEARRRQPRVVLQYAFRGGTVVAERGLRVERQQSREPQCEHQQYGNQHRPGAGTGSSHGLTIHRAGGQGQPRGNGP